MARPVSCSLQPGSATYFCVNSRPLSRTESAYSACCSAWLRQPLTGTYLCEGLSPGAGTYLVFDEKGDYTLYRQSGVLSAGTYAEDANGVYVLKGEGLTVPYVTYDGKDSVHFFSVPDTYTYQRISDIPTYINVEKP